MVLLTGFENHGFCRARKRFEKDGTTESPSQDLQSHRKFSTNVNGTTVHLTLDPSGGHTESHSSPGLPLGPDSICTTSSSLDYGHADHDPDKLHLRNKAMGFFGKAAGQLSHQISKTMHRRRKKDKEGHYSSEEVTTSGELTPRGGSEQLGPATKELGQGTEVPVTGPGVQQQLPSTSKQSEVPLSPASTPSVPPNRPPPGLPHSVAPINLQADNEATESSPPLRPLPTSSGDSRESSTPGQEFLQTHGLPQPAPPPFTKELEGGTIS